MNRIQFLMILSSVVAGNTFAAGAPSENIFVQALDVTVNCLVRPIGYSEQDLCKSVIDLSKIKYVDCLNRPFASANDQEICSGAIHPMKPTSTVNCIANDPTRFTPLERSLCRAVIDTNDYGVSDRVDCTGTMADRYQTDLCESVNLLEQKAVRARLSPLMQR